MKSVRRAFAALDILVGSAPQAVQVTDLAQQLGASVATASRVLATLAEQGYATRTTDRHYTIGVRSLPLATNWTRKLRNAASGPATRVAEQTGEVVVLSQMLGLQQVPLLWRLPRLLESMSNDRLAQLVSPYPLWATASGRALLGGLPPNQRSRLLSTIDTQMTDLTASCSTDITTAIRTGLKEGLHRDQGEFRAGLWCCSVALEPTQSGARLAIAAISIASPTASQELRIHRALRREAFNTVISLTSWE